MKITRPEKILFPDDGITKGDLIHYYERIAPRMVPHLQRRPLSLQRYPDGIDKESFFQKAVARYYPDWIETVTVKKVGGTVKHVVCNNAATLVYLANQACVTLHPWLSREDKLNFPDQMIFDFDPSGDDLAGVISGAHALKQLLDEIGLPAYLKTTGSRGLHVLVPLDRSEDFDSVRAFARELAEAIVATNPERYTLEQYKAKRRGRVFVDINRNAYAQTAVAVYAVRARRGAPVSVPLDWPELRKKSFRPDGITIATIFDRLEKTADPWKDLRRHATSLQRARKKLEKLRITAP